MLEFLFGNKNVEKIIIYLFLHDKCNGSELSRAFQSSLDPIQKTLMKLERGGLLVSFQEGRTRVFHWNPRYVFQPEVRALAEKAYDYLPAELREKLYHPMKRKRPRKSDKPL